MARRWASVYVPPAPVKKPIDTCPKCGVPHALRKDGTLAKHTRTRYLPVDGNYGPRTVQVECSGSHEKPEER